MLTGEGFTDKWTREMYGAEFGVVEREDPKRSPKPTHKVTFMSLEEYAVASGDIALAILREAQV